MVWVLHPSPYPCPYPCLEEACLAFLEVLACLAFLEVLAFLEDPSFRLEEEAFLEGQEVP